MVISREPGAGRPEEVIKVIAGRVSSNGWYAAG